jgi:mannose-6-phosphate isomerase-like protein (cupin superfamily)
METAVEIVHSDVVIDVPPGTTPAYNTRNPLRALLDHMAQVRLAASREVYLAEQLQYLFPIADLTLYGPAGPDHGVLDPTAQDNKTDFQKQNVAGFRTTDTFLVRGEVAVPDWTGPFLRISYRGGPDSVLSQRAGHALGARIKAFVRVGDQPGQTITLPYNESSDRYEVELWAYSGDDLWDRLDSRGQDALRRGELQVRTDLVRGSASDFNREGLDGRYLAEVAPDNTMHPILPLHVELAFSDESESVWDSQDGANYHYEFNMVVRGWDNYLGVGISPNPHGGVGFLEYRNLLSNYGTYAGSRELERTVMPWEFDAFGQKGHVSVEPFMAVNYMDLHIVLPDCGIGLHRHRDNQEVFLMMDGTGLMVVGDWCKLDSRERCMEIRTLRAGHFAMLKGGNLHGLMNPSDENLSLFMFGGYD